MSLCVLQLRLDGGVVFMQISVNGANVIDVSNAVFGCDYNKSLIHQAVVAFLAGGRVGSRKQKTRAEVVGGNKKPWRQKGSGRARAGSSTGPIWRGGGVSFAARPQEHSQKINKKMYRTAMRSILSELVRQERLVVVDEFRVTAPKTKLVIQKLKELSLCNVLIISESIDDNLYLATRNIPNVGLCDVMGSDPVALVGFDKVLITTEAIKAFEGLLG